MSNKVVLVGTGAVGSSYAYAVMNQGLCDELVLVDLNSEKVMGESMDLKHGMVYGPSPMTVKAGEYDDCMDASIVVLSAGAAQKPGETRLDLVKKNMQTYHSIVHNVMKSGFNGIFLVATNPADILTYAVWKFSGLPRKQVIGSGTVLDSARFRTLLAAEFDVSPFSVHASIIGEHGDTQLPVWSAATIAGLPLSPKLSDERKEELGREVREAAYHIIQAKGATSYGIAMGLARITRAILTNERVVLPVGALLEGEYGHHQVCIGSPAVIMRSGVERIVELELTETEKKKLDHSVYTLQDIQSHYWN